MDAAAFLDSVWSEISAKSARTINAGVLEIEDENELDKMLLAHSTVGTGSRRNRGTGSIAGTLAAMQKDRSEVGGGELGDLRLSLSVRQASAAAFSEVSPPVASDIPGGAFGKSLLAKAMSWYVGYLASQTGEFSTATARALRVMAKRIETLDGKVRQLEPMERTSLPPIRFERHQWWVPLAKDAIGSCQGRVVHCASESGWLIQELLDEGLDVYGIDPWLDQELGDDVDRLDMRCEDIAEHFNSIEAGSLSGAVISGVAELMTVGECVSFASRLGSALAPEGTVVLHSHSRTEWDLRLGGVLADLYPSHPLKEETWVELFSSVGIECRVISGPPRDLLEEISDLDGSGAAIDRNFKLLQDKILGSPDYLVIGAKGRGMEK